MEFDRIFTGIVKYMRTYMFTSLNTWQKVIAETAIARVTRSSESVKRAILENFFAKTLKIVDGNLIDVEGLLNDMKKAFNYVPTAEISVPVIGKYKFSVGDVDVLYKCMMEA